MVAWSGQRLSEGDCPSSLQSSHIYPFTVREKKRYLKPEWPQSKVYNAPKIWYLTKKISCCPKIPLALNSMYELCLCLRLCHRSYCSHSSNCRNQKWPDSLTQSVTISPIKLSWAAKKLPACYSNIMGWPRTRYFFALRSFKKYNEVKTNSVLEVPLCFSCCESAPPSNLFKSDSQRYLILPFFALWVSRSSRLYLTTH